MGRGSSASSAFRSLTGSAGVADRRSQPRALSEGALAFAVSAYHRCKERDLISVRQCPLNVCAVTRRRFPVGASPTRQPLQPEATGAVMEVTKWLKPSV